MNEQIEDRNPVEIAAEEFASRVRSGECPSVTEYVDRYPDYAEEISDLLPTVAAMEQLRRTENAQRQTAQLSTLAPRNLPECIGDYRILREIGRGGMGVVYEAQQESLGRLVALKVLTHNRVSSPKHIDRFHREAKSAANLHHTNIVPVFGVGEQDELHYYVMQLIEGVGLDQVISELRLQAKLQDKDPLPPTGSFNSAQMVASEDAARSLRSGRFASGSRSGSASIKSDRERTSKPSADSTLPVPVGETESSIGPIQPLSIDASATDVTADHNSQGELSQSVEISPDAYEQLDDRYWKSVARIGVQLAHALDYAHNQHVLHRDIKPSNLLLDRHDTVWITDFGLAKQVDGDELTKTGDIVGTLRYMAPEQFNGICNRQTDIYSLGVTLFELLTLRPAFGESQQGLLMQKITTAGIDRPRSVNPSIPRDLETIVMKATANEADRRFRTAGELADDLQRYLDDRPIKARRVTSVERMWRWSRRNPAIASLAATLLLVVFSSLVVISWKWGEAERGKQEAQKQSLLAQKESRNAGIERERAQKESERAQKESERAVTENRRAEANLSLALDSMDRFLEHFASSWMAHPSEPVNDEDEEVAVKFRMIVSDQSAIILQDALKFYNQFARKNASNPRLLRDTAKAYQRVGAIHERLGQYVRAEKAYNDAIEILADLQQQFPNDADVAVQTGATVNQLGLVFMALGRYEDAKLKFDRARDTLAVQLVMSANSEECQYELARAFSNLGHVSWRLGKVRDATKNHREALGQFEQLVEQNPQRAEYRLALSRSYRSVFPSGKYGSQWGDPLKNRLQAITILEELVEDFPAVPDYQCELSETLATSWRWLARSADAENIEERLDRAVHLAKQLHSDYPTIPRYQAALADALKQQASHLRRDRAAESEPIYRESIGLYQQLAEKFRAVVAYQFYAAMALNEHGELLREMGRLNDSRVAIESAIDHQERYLEKRSGSGFGERMLSRQYASLAKTLTELGETDMASKVQEESEKMRAEAEKHFAKLRRQRGGGRRGPIPGRGRPSMRDRPPGPSRSRVDSPERGDPS